MLNFDDGLQVCVDVGQLDWSDHLLALDTCAGLLYFAALHGGKEIVDVEIGLGTVSMPVTRDWTGRDSLVDGSH